MRYPEALVSDPMEVRLVYAACFPFHVAAELMYESVIFVPFQVPVVTVPTVVIAVDPVHVDNAVDTSANTIVLNDGVPADPFGAAKNVLAVCDASVAVSVPEVVTGDPLTVKILGNESPTLVTVPEPPPEVAHDNVPDPLLYRYPVEFAKAPNVDKMVYAVCLAFHVAALFM